MFFANWTSKPQVCLSDPSFNHASRLPTANEKQAASAERKSRFVARASERIHCSWWESRYNVHCLCFSEPLAETRVGTAVWLASKSNPDRRVQRVYGRSDDRTRRESISCTWKSMCSTNRHPWFWWHNCGAHNCRHNQIARSSHFLNLRQSSSALAQTKINTQHTPSTDTCEPGITTVCQKGPKQNHHALNMIS